MWIIDFSQKQGIFSLNARIGLKIDKNDCQLKIDCDQKSKLSLTFHYCSYSHEGMKKVKTYFPKNKNKKIKNKAESSQVFILD